MRGNEALCPRYFRDSDDRDKHVADYDNLTRLWIKRRDQRQEKYVRGDAI